MFDFLKDSLAVFLVILEEVVSEDNPDLAFDFFENRQELLEQNP